MQFVEFSFLWKLETGHCILKGVKSYLKAAHMVLRKIAVVSLPAMILDDVQARKALLRSRLLVQISRRELTCLKRNPERGYGETCHGGMDGSFSRAFKNRERKSLSLAWLATFSESDKARLSSSRLLANCTIGDHRAGLSRDTSLFLTHIESSQGSWPTLMSWRCQ